MCVSEHVPLSGNFVPFLRKEIQVLGLIFHLEKMWQLLVVFHATYMIFSGIKARIYNDGAENFLGYFSKSVAAIKIGRKVIDIYEKNSIIM